MQVKWKWQNCIYAQSHINILENYCVISSFKLICKWTLDLFLRSRLLISFWQTNEHLYKYIFNVSTKTMPPMLLSFTYCTYIWMEHTINSITMPYLWFKRWKKQHWTLDKYKTLVCEYRGMTGKVEKIHEKIFPRELNFFFLTFWPT